MQRVNGGKEKQSVYSKEYKQFNKALKEEFYLEAIGIGYAIIEDRLIAFLHHAGIVSRNQESLKINKKVYPYFRILMNTDENHKIIVNKITVKIDLINKILNMSEEEALNIDKSVAEYIEGIKRKNSIAAPGYMRALYLQKEKVKKDEVLSTLNRINPWKEVRNQLIHALLNKTTDSAYEAKKKCAEESYSITRDLDNALVKPFKRHNQLRKKYNIQ